VNEVLRSSTDTFSWSDVGADEYRVTISSGPLTFYDQRFVSDMISVAIDDLPLNSSPLNFGLLTRHGDGWSRQGYIFTSTLLKSSKD